MFHVIVEVPFEAGHRIIGHKGRCNSYHGHSYRTKFEVVAHSVNALGMIVDFGDLKKVLKAWIDEKLDHGMILANHDPMVNKFTEEKTKVYLMMGSPTAENIAKELYTQLGLIIEELFPITLTQVFVQETEKCSASYSR